jgi:signal transduction histidine kinase
MAGVHVGGVLYVQVDSSDAIAGSTLDLLITLADQVGIGLANAQLYAEAQEAQRVAESASQTKSEFLANMSHELRTPLNAILGYAQLLQRSDMLDGKHRNYLETILHSGEHLRDLINEILDMSKIEAGRMELVLERVDLRALIEGVIAASAALIKGRPIELCEEIEQDLPAIWADGARIRQVITNLMSNAAKFTRQGSITFRAWSS